MPPVRNVIVCAAVLFLAACAPLHPVLRPPEEAQIARIDSVLAVTPPGPRADSLSTARARLIGEREERLALAAFVAAGVAVAPAVVYILIRDLTR